MPCPQACEDDPSDVTQEDQGDQTHQWLSQYPLLVTLQMLDPLCSSHDILCIFRFDGEPPPPLFMVFCSHWKQNGVPLPVCVIAHTCRACRQTNLSFTLRWEVWDGEELIFNGYGSLQVQPYFSKTCDEWELYVDCWERCWRYHCQNRHWAYIK